MTNLPRWWFGAPPELSPGEHFEASYPANRSQGKHAVGGGLHFTNTRVLFTPNTIDASMGGKKWSCRLVDISAVGVEPGRFALTELFSGGLRARLRIEQKSGETDLFVISGPEAVAASFETLLQRARG
jgi:hypothetical protein